MTRRTDEGDVTRLPQWAQRKLRNLEAQAANLQAHIDELKSSHPDSNVKVSPGIRDDYGLPPDSEIDFYLGDSREKWRDMITVQHLRTKDRKVLRISGNGQLVLLPSGGCNMIEIRTERHT